MNDFFLKKLIKIGKEKSRFPCIRVMLPCAKVSRDETHFENKREAPKIEVLIRIRYDYAEDCETI